MTPHVLATLKVMLEDPSASYYGYRLVKAAGVPNGSLYPTLAKLRRAGWVTASWENIDPMKEGRPARRLYRLTPLGERCAKAELEAAINRFSPMKPAFGVS